MLGQHTPWSSAISASDIKTSFAVGVSACFQAQFMAVMLISGE
jgi:hypothetical protein